MEEVKEFKTRDMFLSACCMVEGIKYVRAERDAEDKRRLIFVFEDNPEISRIVTQRANATHIVSSVSYDDALRRLKSIIHSL